MITTEFIDEGTYLKVVTSESGKKLKKLPPAIYLIDKCEEGGYRLTKEAERFEQKGKVFGKQLGKITKVAIDHFVKEQTPTGLIAVGLKGCGKSKLCENIANVGMNNHDLPVLLIRDPLPKSVVLNALKAASPCILYIDEYEKLYKPDFRKNQGSDAPNEDELLTVFSDKNLGPVLTLITANNKSELSPYILDRPERFLFRIEYKGVDKDVVEEICDHYKLHKDIKEYIADYAEDTNANLDTCVTLAKHSTSYTKPSELKEIFDVYNMIKPKQWGWRIFTRSGAKEGFDIVAERKNLYVTNTETGQKWEINFDNYYSKFQYNRAFNCFTLHGMGGESENVNIGFIPTGPINEEESEPIVFFRLENQNAMKGQ